MTKGKKKALIIILSIVGVIVIAAVITLTVFLTRKPAEPPVSEGEIYQTAPETFWVGVGSAYISFGYKEAPIDKEEGDTALYGYVFNVNVNAGDGYSSWLSGTWDLEEENGMYGKLTLTAAWDETAKNQTTLAGTESGVAKIYEPSDGKYTIGVNLPSAGTINFTLDPVTDKVGEGETTTPPCTEHIDADKDGKCDKCGKDMPTPPVDPETPELQLAMSAVAETGQNAKIEMFTDNTWILSISYYQGGEFTETASGNWEMKGYTEITMTVAKDTANVISSETFAVMVDASDTSNIKYSCSLSCTIPTVGELKFDFTNAVEEIPEATIQITLESPVNAAGQSAKIDIYTDNTWKLSISYYSGGGYTETASGTWAMNGFEGMTLTVGEDVANVLDTDNIAVSFDAVSSPGNILYKATVKCNLPVGGNITFEFSASMALEI